MEHYTSEMAGGGQYGICVKCKKAPTKEGHDGCLGTLPGAIMNACCGHGNVHLAYIQYYNSKKITGNEAICEQIRLLENKPASDPDPLPHTEKDP